MQYYYKNYFKYFNLKLFDYSYFTFIISLAIPSLSCIGY